MGHPDESLFYELGIKGGKMLLSTVTAKEFSMACLIRFRTSVYQSNSVLVHLIKLVVSTFILYIYYSKITLLMPVPKSCQLD